ncbi:antibiotic biosynthesis monooxygenase family protein [Endozoicomonas numazuensis]|uniref:Antibiotic biosynthesis monooxygenase n=1 Tax=Endozoicomonas numazuensis TaxID=1137799 RepID=A0A081NF88_9GAMM|nr:antibiotic biosynthesis monooxygenase [Endozoicomonas numazuensis]KEQ17111.1 antibiotic biosynthesis monooxygenase [Endozoicomonas numazuensis]
MYAVIFRATLKKLDQEYTQKAQRMRELALNEYGCIEFIANTEGDQELAISYWPDKESIRAWKNNPEHLSAQQKGKTLWYQDYQVEIVEVLHKYQG